MDGVRGTHGVLLKKILRYRPFGRHRCRWDNIKIVEHNKNESCRHNMKVYWIHSSQNSGQDQGHVNIILDLTECEINYNYKNPCVLHNTSNLNRSENY